MTSKQVMVSENEENIRKAPALHYGYSMPWSVCLLLLLLSPCLVPPHPCSSSGVLQASAQQSAPSPPAPPPEIAHVYIESLTIFTTHDFAGWTPTVFFRCQEGKKRFLTGVEKPHQEYKFTTHESFQPVAALEPPRCQRCGFYEEDTWTDPDIFDEWELCPLEFSPGAEGGRLTRYKEKEFNVTFVCLNCNHNLPARNGGRQYAGAESPAASAAFIGLIVFGCSMAVTFILAGIMYCAKEGLWPFPGSVDEDTRKFMQMFDEEDELLEEDDDLELEMTETKQDV